MKLSTEDMGMATTPTGRTILLNPLRSLAQALSTIPATPLNRTVVQDLTSLTLLPRLANTRNHCTVATRVPRCRTTSSTHPLLWVASLPRSSHIPLHLTQRHISLPV
jgi:hypothetical protein